MSPLSRRRFLTLAGAAGAIGASGALTSVRAATPSSSHNPNRLPDPRTSGIDHVVVVCMENRSFDHYLGWVPGADGEQDGLVYVDDDGLPHATHHLTERQGCGFNDPDHSYEGGRVQLNGGKCDGFRKGSNDDFAIGYYTRDDLPLNAALVDNFTVFDHWFCSILGPTYPNRFYTHAAQTDRIENSSTTATLPTIWDLLAAAGVPATYYFSDVPFLGLWGEKYLPISQSIDHFYARAASGTLPAFSYVDPAFLGEDQGGSNDDHPHADILRGQSLLSTIVNAVTSSPLWGSTVLIITYDEWGGFFDHVAPPKYPDAFKATKTEEHNTAGFRVPTYIVSPFAPKQIVHNAVEHTSILKLVEWRWNLPPLTPRDAAAVNPARFLDFSRPNLLAPAIPSVTDPGPHLCGSPDTGMAAEDPFWRELANAPGISAWR